MRFAVLGTGRVGATIAHKLITLGHEVCMGARSATNDKAAAWVTENGPSASQGTFADAAAFGALVFNCTAGMHALTALASAGAENLDGKVLVDVSNALDFTGGFPPTLAVCNDDSLAEQIQRAFPGARVVKTLNTMNCDVMVEPGRVAGRHDVFISGNDPEAKAQVRALLGTFGWEDPIDLGDITTARGTEMFLPLWVRLYSVLGTGDFQLAVVR